MNETITPAEIMALKQDIMSSLHCALPGVVESFDAQSQTAAIRPVIRTSGIELPLVRDVPVFFPGSRESAVTWPVSAGDECLLVFADLDIDSWYESGNSQDPVSARQHDLSDAFAFVGFRSRLNALGEVAPNPSFFGMTETGIDEKLAGKADTAHKHAAGDITTGSLAVARGGSGQSGTSASTTVANVAVAASGCTITTAQFACWGKVAMVRLVITKKAAVTSGTTTLATIVEGRRPRYFAVAERGWGEGARITSSGEVQVNGAISAGESITILSTYVMA